MGDKQHIMPFLRKQQVTRLSGSPAKLHGLRGDPTWTAPREVSHSDEANRADQGNKTCSSEYMDEPDVLEAKVNMIVSFLRAAHCCTAYTGAGLSRASGIGDYASKKTSINANIPQIRSGYEAEPTYSHRVLVALERAGYLHHYVQQNHDGLPQKAGFPQEKINEIHGAWYDPSNPVVQFSGNLRSDLFDWMIKMEKKTDLCLCLGTSLSGMNADRMADTPAKRAAQGQKIIGTVIINLQQTRLDSSCTVRVWAQLDDVFRMIAEKLELDMTPVAVDLPAHCDNQFVIPYNESGLYDPDSRMIWDLRDGASIHVTNPEACNYKETGEIIRKDRQGNYMVGVGRHRYHFGKWWVKCAMEGQWPYHLPFVNIEPVMLKDEMVPAFVQQQKSPTIPTTLQIVQTHRFHEKANTHECSLSLPDPTHSVQSVTWKLHPTFSPSKLTLTQEPFSITRTGWGTFGIKAKITLINGRTITAKHGLSFAGDGSTTTVSTEE